MLPITVSNDSLRQQLHKIAFLQDKQPTWLIGDKSYLLMIIINAYSLCL